MKKSFKIVVSLMMVFAILSSKIILADAYGGGEKFVKSNVISGKIVCHEKNDIDISALKLKVFRLELLKDDKSSSEYAHVYETTVSPDKYGNVSIRRPSDYCYIEISEESIPAGFGVNSNSVLVSWNESKFSITVSPITNFKFDFFNDKADFFDNKNNSLFVNSKFKVEYDGRELKKAFLDDSAVNVRCVFDDFCIESKQTTNELSMTDKIDYLSEKNLINETEKINLYISNLNNERINEDSEIIKALSVINSFSLNNALSEEMNKEITNLTSSYIPSYENEQTYTYKFFTLHYEDGSISDTNLHILALYLNYAKNSLCFTFCFETPNLLPGESTYHVYLTSGENYSGLTVPVSISGTTYTFINININNGNNTLSNYTLGTACHEFMHAVQFQYDSYNVNQHYNEMVHFNEAVANSVKVRLIQNCGIKFFVDRFQNSPDISLLSSPASGDYQYRCYGAVLFPLCIEQEYSSFNTIRGIYEEIHAESLTVRDVYTAIDEVLQQSNSSIQEAYTKCALYNYNIQNYYNYCENNWQTCAKLSDVTTTNTSYFNSYLTTRYFEITNSTYSGFALTFSSSNYNDAELQRVDTINGNLSETHYSIFSQTITAVYHIDPGQRTCMILSNKSLTSSIVYSVRVVN